MAAGRIVLSQYFPARDRNGRLVAGALLYVYTNGTTTKASIFAEEALSTPLANPVAANSSGQFPAIWASDAVTYTLSITAADGSSIGNPSVFDDYSVSTDADTASVALAEAAATAAEEAYADVLAVVATGSDAAAIAARAAKSANGSDFADTSAVAANIGGTATGISVFKAATATAARTAIGSDLAANVSNTLPAGANLRAQPLSDYVDGGPIMPSMFEGTEEQRFLRGLTEAAADRNGGLGNRLLLPRGEIDISATFNNPNRVNIIGANKRGSVLKATSGFTGTYMVTAINGGVSTFDNALERLNLDCNNVASLGGVIADAWQEGGGLRKVLINKFTTNGVYIRNGDGGASTCLIDDCEIFGSATDTAECGIYVEEVSDVGNFILRIANTTVTGGGTGFEMPYGVYFENDSSVIEATHFEDIVSGIYIDGVGNHVILGCSGANTVTNLVEIAATFTGSLTMIGCLRGGATNLVKDNRSGGFGNIAYDTQVTIRSEPELAIGANIAGGSFDGSLTPPTTGNSFGVSSFERESAGVYYANLSRAGTSAYSFSILASTSYVGGTVECSLANPGYVKIIVRNSAGTAIDDAEVKFLITRVK